VPTPTANAPQTFAITVPGGGPGGPLAGHALPYHASVVGKDGQAVSIIQSDPFVLA
jgi:hypothetical protein